MKDTIIAQITPKGQGSVGIIKISGKKTLEIAKTITRKNLIHKKVFITKFFSKKNEFFDIGVAILFKKPKSYTGEDILELHTHGNQYLINNMINYIIKNFNIRLAKPGEFTLRAFLNKKIDLIQAESIKQIVDTKDPKIHKIIFKNCEGKFSKKLKIIIKYLRELKKQIEVKIDFSENEELIEDKLILKSINNIFNSLKSINKNILLDNQICNDTKICIVGNSNVGKSTFFNKLINKEKSIVTNLKGTTRDIIEEKFKIFNTNIILYDTAGYRLTKNIIENKGIQLTKELIKKCELIIYISDKKIINNIFKEHFFQEIIKKKKQILIIQNKYDKIKNNIFIKHINNFKIIQISSTSNFKIKTILKIIKNFLKKKKINNKTYISTNRIKFHLTKSFEIIKNIKNLFLNNTNLDILSKIINDLVNNIEEILGKKIHQNLIKDIFKDFCIGK